MIISLQWSEWLRRPAIRQFDAASPIAVEDYLDGKLPADTAVFVFDDLYRPMLQSIESQWGHGRFSTKQMAEIFNALVVKERRVAKFANRDVALQQLALEIMHQGKIAPITNLRNHTVTNEQLHQHTDHRHEHAGAERVEAEAAKAESPAEVKKQAAARAKAEKEAAKAEKAEEKAAAVAAAAEAKAAAKAEKDAAKAAKAVKAPKPEGVIGSLIVLLTDGHKRTVDELFDNLLEKFPDRGEGMKTTVRVQLARLTKEGRLVVHAEDRHDAEGKKLVGKNYWGEAVAGGAQATADTATLQQEAAE